MTAASAMELLLCALAGPDEWAKELYWVKDALDDPPGVIRVAEGCLWVDKPKATTFLWGTPDGSGLRNDWSVGLQWMSGAELGYELTKVDVEAWLTVDFDDQLRSWLDNTHLYRGITELAIGPAWAQLVGDWHVGGPETGEDNNWTFGLEPAGALRLKQGFQ